MLGWGVFSASASCSRMLHTPGVCEKNGLVQTVRIGIFSTTHQTSATKIEFTLLSLACLVSSTKVAVSSKKIAVERHKLLLDAYGKEVLKTTSGKRVYFYPTSKCSILTRKSPRKKSDTVDVTIATVAVQPKADASSTVPKKLAVKRRLDYIEDVSTKIISNFRVLDSNSVDGRESGDESDYKKIKAASTHKENFAMSDKEGKIAVEKELVSGRDAVEPTDSIFKDIIIEELKKVLRDNSFHIVGNSRRLSSFEVWTPSSPQLANAQRVGRGFYERVFRFLLVSKTNRVLEEKVIEHYNTIASQEVEKIELCDKMESLEKEQPIVVEKGIMLTV
ncbi:hypothetical protein OUZ56_011973 [Daphnia magna]|uniref:Uncharacterized protein n=1 Tax=Daphnia magna TaxID=35525 RepID=A0ABQ9Z1Z6_9CRUS|nr:hypothetical protein OUZ56_011973 [Daphnia magna]